MDKQLQDIRDLSRAFAKNEIAKDVDLSNYQTDQQLKKPQPPLCKAAVSDVIIDLPKNFKDVKVEGNFTDLLFERKSHRVYTQKNITLEQLSYLCFACAGVLSIRGKSYVTLRTVPAGGARHPYELYFAANYVEGLKPGYYHYLPLTHQIELIKEGIDTDEISASLVGQAWAAKASVVFYLDFVFYRSEWRYGILAHAPALMDIGYIGQNIYLASTTLNLGSCAIAALDKKLANQMFNIGDGSEECMVYAHPVGTIDALKNKAEENSFYSFVKEDNL